MSFVLTRFRQDPVSYTQLLSPMFFLEGNADNSGFIVRFLIFLHDASRTKREGIKECPIQISSSPKSSVLLAGPELLTRPEEVVPGTLGM